MTRFAPFFELYCSNTSSASPSAVNAYNLEEKYDRYIDYKRIDMHHGFLTNIASVHTPSVVFTPTSDRRRRCRATKSSFFTTIEQVLINLILPGKPEQSRKPSQVLGSTRQSQCPAGPKPSQVLAPIKVTGKRRVAMSLTADQELIGNTEPRIMQGPNTSEETIPVSSFISFPKREAPLRVALLKRRVLKSGMETPRRPVPIVEDNEDDDEMEQRMNEFEGWNEYG